MNIPMDTKLPSNLQLLTSSYIPFQNGYSTKLSSNYTLTRKDITDMYEKLKLSQYELVKHCPLTSKFEILDIDINQEQTFYKILYIGPLNPNCLCRISSYPTASLSRINIMTILSSNLIIEKNPDNDKNLLETLEFRSKNIISYTSLSIPIIATQLCDNMGKSLSFYDTNAKSMFESSIKANEDVSKEEILLRERMRAPTLSNMPKSIQNSNTKTADPKNISSNNVTSTLTKFPTFQSIHDFTIGFEQNETSQSGAGKSNIIFNLHSQLFNIPTSITALQECIPKPIHIPTPEITNPFELAQQFSTPYLSSPLTPQIHEIEALPNTENAEINQVVMNNKDITIDPSTSFEQQFEIISNQQNDSGQMDNIEPVFETTHNKNIIQPNTSSKDEENTKNKMKEKMNLLAHPFDTKLCPNDCNLLAFIHDRNIYVHDILSGKTLQLTQSQNKDVLCGIPSFVTQEEFDRFTGYYWKPIREQFTISSQSDNMDKNNNINANLFKYTILYEENDECTVETLKIPTVLGDNLLKMEEQKFPRPGTNNSITRLKLVHFLHDYGKRKFYSFDLNLTLDGKDVWKNKTFNANDNKYHSQEIVSSSFGEKNNSSFKILAYPFVLEYGFLSFTKGPNCQTPSINNDITKTVKKIPKITNGNEENSEMLFNNIDHIIFCEPPLSVEYIVRFGWILNTDYIYIQGLNRTQTSLKTFAISSQDFSLCGFGPNINNAFPNSFLVNNNTTIIHRKKNKNDTTHHFKKNITGQQEQLLETSHVAIVPKIYPLYEETCQFWINICDILCFLPQKYSGEESVDTSSHNKPKTLTFIISSEESGFRHLYKITTTLKNMTEKNFEPDIDSKMQLTNGEWVVFGEKLWVDESRKLLYFIANKDGPLEKHLYVTSYEKPFEPIRLTQIGFSHGIHMDKKCRIFVDCFSSVNAPTHIYVYQICHVKSDCTMQTELLHTPCIESKLVKILYQPEQIKVENLTFPPPQFFDFEVPDFDTGNIDQYSMDEKMLKNSLPPHITQKDKDLTSSPLPKSTTNKLYGMIFKPMTISPLAATNNFDDFSHKTTFFEGYNSSASANGTSSLTPQLCKCSLDDRFNTYFDRLIPPTYEMIEADNEMFEQNMESTPEDSNANLCLSKDAKSIKIDNKNIEDSERTEMNISPLPQIIVPHCRTLLYVYGGPQVQQVTNTYKGNQYLRLYCLTALGFTCIVIDNRGSANRGKAFESVLKGKMGSTELSDQICGLEYVASKTDIIDMKNVGIHGWSYGGYLSLMGIIKYPSVFKLSLSGAPVTSWSQYDTGYTERYMGVKQKLSDFFTNLSDGLLNMDNTKNDMPFADKIKNFSVHAEPNRKYEDQHDSDILDKVTCLPDDDNKLMLIHGLIDENVHFHNTSLLIQALIKHNKPYRLLIYPNERHGLKSYDSCQHFEISFLKFLYDYL